MNIIQILYDLSRSNPDRDAFHFLFDKFENIETVTYKEIYSMASNFASILNREFSEKIPAIICLPPGKNYIVTFLGCLIANHTPVPLYPIRRGRDLKRIKSILETLQRGRVIHDGDPVSTKALSEYFTKYDIQNLNINKLNFEGLPAIEPPRINSEDIAYLQFTSGSTSHPRGVIVSHKNIIENEKMIAECFKLDGSSRLISWLPPFHDMGMIGTILQPIFSGFPCVIMSAAHFIQRPIDWLRAISKFSATVTGAPNSAYDHCIRRVSDEDLSGIDLSSLRVAFNGAEPIRSETLEEFGKKFGKVGFKKEAFLACYGLAEATLLVSGRNSPPKSLQVNVDAMEQNQIQPVAAGGKDFIDCGKIANGLTVAIVDPNTLKLITSDNIGEIWVKGPSISPGYYNNKEKTKEVFENYLERSDGPYLRTGDLGFFHNGELYICGRIKDLIIIRGRNIYPQDIEESLAQIALLRSGSIAVVSSLNSSEMIAIAAEVDRSASPAQLREICGAIRRIVSEDFEASVFEIVLLKQGALPRTTSGKIQRALIATQISKNEDINAIYTEPVRETVAVIEQPLSPNISLKNEKLGNSHQTASTLKEWITEYFSKRVNMRILDERRMLSPNIILELGNKGIMGLQAPTGIGGANLTLTDMMSVVQHLASVDLTIASLVGIHNALGLRPLLNFGASAEHIQYRNQLASGRAIGSFALTEPQAGSNPRAIASTIKRSGQSLILNGEKKYIGLASWASSLIVFAKESSSEGNFGLTAVMVPANQDGLIIGDEEITLGIRAITRNKVYFKDCVIPERYILGVSGQGFLVAKDAMNMGRLGILAMSIGGMERCLQVLISYTQNRHISTGIMLNNGKIRQTLSDIVYRIRSCESLLQTITQTSDHDNSPLPEEITLIAKVAGSEFFGTSVDAAIQGLGGRGYTENNRIAQLYRDGRLLRIFEGPSEALLAHLGTAWLAGNREVELWLEKLGYVSQFENFEGDKYRKLEKKCFEQAVGEYILWNTLCTLNQADKHTSLWLELQVKSSLENIEKIEVLQKTIISKDQFVNYGLELNDKIGKIESKGPWENQKPDEELLIQTRKKEVNNNIFPFPKNEMKNVESRAETRNAVVNEASVQINKHTKRRASSLSDLPLEQINSPSLGKIETKSESNDLEDLLLTWLSHSIGVAKESIDPLAAISNLGIDSVVAMEAMGYMETKTGLILPNDLFWNVPNIREAIRHIEKLSGQKKIKT